MKLNKGKCEALQFGGRAKVRFKSKEHGGNKELLGNVTRVGKNVCRVGKNVTNCKKKVENQRKENA